MESITLGSTDVRVPVVGLGTSSYSGGPGPLRRAIELGAGFIDTAEIYGSEPVVGEALEGCRHGAFVATKVWKTNLEPTALKRAAQASLERLGLDCIDLYQIHWPYPTVPIEDSIRAMEELADEGLVRYLGVSNFTEEELDRAMAAARHHPIVSNQVSLSLIDRRATRGMLEYCREHRVTLIAYSPLGRGLARMLDRDRDGELSAIARETGHTPAQVALNWCIGHEGVVVIPKSSSAARIEENCGAAGWRLTDEQRARLEASVREARPPYRRRGPLEDSARAIARRTLERVGLRRPRH